MNLHTPLISVIIPAYNTAVYMKAAIESVLHQTHRQVEVIVINDGSPDDTDEVIKPFLPFIQYIKQQNQGLSAARNVGFRASKGEFICFLDADDMLMPEKFERQLTVFAREPDLGVVLCGYFDVDKDGHILQEVPKSWHRDALARFLNHEVFPPHAPLIRRSVFENSAMFPEDIVTTESQEDWQLWLDMALNGVRFSSVPESLCKYRRRSGSISSANPLKHLDGARRVVKWLRSHPKSGAYKKQIDRLENIVEMERVARAVQVGQSSLAAEILVAAVNCAPLFWEDVNTSRLLFERSLTVQEFISWKADPNPEFFRYRIFDQILSLGSGKIPMPLFDRIKAAGYLYYSDLAYGCRQDSLRTQAVKKALRSSFLICLRPGNLASLLRGLIGPRVIALMRRHGGVTK